MCSDNAGHSCIMLLNVRIDKITVYVILSHCQSVPKHPTFNSGGGGGGGGGDDDGKSTCMPQA